MDSEKQLAMIRDLSNASGACGFEDDVLSVLRSYGAGLGKFQEDSLRNLYLEREGNQANLPVVPDVNFQYDKSHGLMIGKAFDCRLGCAAIIGTLDELKGGALMVNVTAGFAAQEEMGTRGATVTAGKIRPDIAIVFEGCPADDTFTEPYLTQTAIKHGPMLRHIDARMITNPRFQRFALDLANRFGIPAQESVRSGGSTDGAPIHLSNSSVPVIVIGLPVRYIHSYYGIASFSDYENAVNLAVAVIKSLNRGIISKF